MSKPESQPNPKENRDHNDRNGQNDRNGRLNRYSAYLYLAMALLIVAVATFSIFALNRSIELPSDYSTPDFSIDLPSHTPTPSPEYSEPSVWDPDTSSGGGREPQTSDDRPVIGEQSGVEGDDPKDPPAGTEEPRFVCPVASERILKPCALDRLVFSATMKDYRAHTGLDLASPLGGEVLCYTAGTVDSVQDDPFYGKVVTVQHAYGLVTVYANLAPELAEGIRVGKELKAGDCIGYVGTTAIAETADEPHLHFEMLMGGERIDPEKELFG